MDDGTEPTETRRRRAAVPVAARLAGVAVHYPAAVLDNQAIAARHVRFQPDKVSAKTGIERRYRAAPDETASDLACHAAEKLFAADPPLRSSVDYLIFARRRRITSCPAVRAFCIAGWNCVPMRVRSTSISGCSGFVYGLGQAVGLIASGQAERVLLLTADTYSKFISEDDIGALTIFGDGAAAVLIEADPDGAIGPFVYGTDGTGAGA